MRSLTIECVLSLQNVSRLFGPIVNTLKHTDLKHTDTALTSVNTLKHRDTARTSVSLTIERVLVLQNAFSHYRMCSFTTQAQMSTVERVSTFTRTPPERGYAQVCQCFIRSLLPYDRSLLPYDRSLLPCDRSLLSYDRSLL